MPRHRDAARRAADARPSASTAAVPGARRSPRPRPRRPGRPPGGRGTSAPPAARRRGRPARHAPLGRARPRCAAGAPTARRRGRPARHAPLGRGPCGRRRAARPRRRRCRAWRGRAGWPLRPDCAWRTGRAPTARRGRPRRCAARGRTLRYGRCAARRRALAHRRPHGPRRPRRLPTAAHPRPSPLGLAERDVGDADRRPRQNHRRQYDRPLHYVPLGAARFHHLGAAPRTPGKH